MYAECIECCTNEKSETDKEAESGAASDGLENNTKTVTFQNRCRHDKKMNNVDWWRTEFKKHIHQKRVQVAEFNRKKSNLKKNETLIQCDYRENYKNREQDEVPRAHFGYSSFNIFMWVLQTKWRP